MPKLIEWREGRAVAVDDAFTTLADDAPVPAGDLILSLDRFEAEGEALMAEGRRIGVLIQADQPVEGLAYDLPRLAVVALNFPKFRDGRAFSAARILRERFKFQGQIRAVGDVLLEQAKFMIRCGFDAFEPADGTTAGEWTAADQRFRHVYQRAADNRPPAFAQRLSAEVEVLDRVDARNDAALSLETDLRDASPQAILKAALERYGDRLALVSSFGAEAAVLLHMAAQIKPDIPVLFLDTGMLFGQTLDYRQKLAKTLGLTNVITLRPRFEDLATADPHADLWKTDTDSCCHIRKVIPLEHALKDFDAWLTGRKKFHGGDRIRLSVVETEGSHVKFNPLANWTKADLDAYVAEHDLPLHPLVSQGYPSIGCWPCTQPVEEGEDVRAGRWAGSQKTECGIHRARAPGVAPFVGGDI